MMDGHLGPLNFLVGGLRPTLITGVEADPLGGTRVYVGPRWKWRYILVEGDDAQRVRRAWDNTTQHLFFDLPIDAEVLTDPWLSGG